MDIPSIEALEHNLRETLVLKAEELAVLAGGEVGARLVAELTGVNDVGGVPTDWFASEGQLIRIDLDRLAITTSVRDLHDRLNARALGIRVGDGWLSSDEIEQEALDPIEQFLSSLSHIALAAYDWTSSRNGALKQLLHLGKAWHHLIEALDAGSQGDFSSEPLTVTDVANLAGIEERTLRNRVGKNGPLRSVEQYRQRKSAVSHRGFVAINRFDAIDWLLSRRGFTLGNLRPGLLASRLEQISEPATRARAALISGMALGQRLERIANETGCATTDVKLLADGHGPLAFIDPVVTYIIDFDRARLSNTAPAE